MVKFEYRPMENANNVSTAITGGSNNPEIAKKKKVFGIIFGITFAIPFFMSFFASTGFIENHPGLFVLLTFLPFIAVGVFIIIIIVSIAKGIKTGQTQVYRTDKTEMERVDGSFVTREVVEFDEYGFYITDYDSKEEKTTLEYTYSHIDKVVESQSAFMVTIHGVGTKVLYKHNITDGDVNLFYDLLLARVSSKRLNIFKR